MNNRLIAVGALVALVACGAVSAQGWPNRPIRLIVPFAAGGPSDVVGRGVAARLQENLGQPVIVAIRARANSPIGATLGAKGQPEGTQRTDGSVGSFDDNIVHNLIQGT